MRNCASQSVWARSDELFEEHLRAIREQTDRLFVWLLLGQWLAAIAIAFWISPLTWAGASSELHPHVWLAIFLGGLIVSYPGWMAWRHPGRAGTRHGVAVAQMLMGALFIHLSGGRIETHFHVFGSLAFLAFYRDWRVLITGTVIVAADHLIRGFFFPQSVFGVTTASSWRWLEHVGWVAFEDFFLIQSCLRSMREMRTIADRQAEVEIANFDIEQTVLDRTSELKQRNQQLEELTRKLGESQQQFRNAFDHAPIGMALVATDGRWLETNKALSEIVGYSSEELLNRTFQDITHPDDLEPDLAQVRQMLDGAIREYQIEKRYFHQDGRTVWVLLNVTLVRDSEGRPLHFISQIQDITARRQADAELRVAKEAAEAANRAKSEFLANMSHEIRTPMNGIIGMTELLLDTYLSPEQRDYLRTVKMSGEALVSVINDILDFSKIEAGKLDMESIDFDLREVISGTMRTLALRAHEKRLELAYDVVPEVPDALVGDPGRIRQILVNLVGNAIKFTEQGEVVVRVDQEETAADEVLLHFAVSDTGVGIPLEKQQLIFEAFSQADGSVTRKYGGTGLGLTISSHLVDRMGGRIWVESDVGRGSTFHFLARCGKRSARTAPDAVALLPALHGMRALVVDDNSTNRRILRDMLTNWKVKPVVVGCGREALAALKQAFRRGEPFDFLLLDVMMPEMDGFSVAEQIRADPELASVMILMLTSGGQNGEIDRCRALGVASYLVKPVYQSELLQRIGAALHLARPARELREPPNPPPSDDGVLRVLVAEDNAVNQRVAEGMLLKRGYRVTICGNGREALEALRRQAFDVVLMDVQMPEMDGFEATACIRALEEFDGGRMPIVAMTAHVMKGDRERCLAAGMDDYISKPIDSEELFRVIDCAVGSGTDGPRVVEKDDTKPDIDLEAALSRLGHDRELLAEVAGMFLDGRPRLLAEIRDALGRGDAEELRHRAHSLKGSLGYFGAVRAGETAGKLEAMAENGELAAARETVLALEREIERLQTVLADLIGDTVCA